MSERDEQPPAEAKRTGVNPGYAMGQLAKALMSIAESADPEVRERARAKVARWEAVLTNMLTGSVEYGSRAPVQDVPPWATLEVITGGFATGQLLAGGPLLEHEQPLLARLPSVEPGAERRVLNGYFLSDEGLQDLQDRLAKGRYEINVPEEAALLVAAWLAQREHTNEARDLIESLAPYFEKLRFYPVPTDKSQSASTSRAHLQTVGETLHDLKAMRKNLRVLAQKEAVEIWAPLYDRMVELLAETVVNDTPCARFPSDWATRASLLLQRYSELRNNHRLCSKPERPKYHFAQVRELLRRAAEDSRSVTSKDIARLRTILQRYVTKRGAPGSAQCVAARQRQLNDVTGPTHQQIATVVSARLQQHPTSEGLDSIDGLIRPIAEAEAATFDMPAGTAIPESILHKIERCLNQTIDELIERGLVSSGETLARLLPQITSGLRARGFSDPALRTLYAATYRAFRRRRSLLLLNLESQVRLNELPWVAAMERFRIVNGDERAVARQALEEVSAITISAFPHVILPNKLLQELRALIKGAGRDTPLVDELAADIFMGQFSGKFVKAAHIAAWLLEGSLYATYFDIDYQQVLSIRVPQSEEGQRRDKKPQPDELAELCASRAGVQTKAGRSTAENGMIIEQQQILTTQNLAPLFVDADLNARLRNQLWDMADRCFRWICQRHQMKLDDPHSRLLMLKNTAYAWRQMIFYLSLQDRGDVAKFLASADAHLREQSEGFQQRFAPVLRGLANAVQGKPATDDGGRRFLGWSNVHHWLLPGGSP
ncbi:MAG TPA: hypothetical protein VGD45_00745 [Steroidobacter sp.]|uniref:hypothetical protein n=1 Tax=Steroidobacter sp. TaxID=1978227 RepID=UPI002EDADA53